MSKKEVWVIGVSGGADSMALLSMLKNQYTCIVAHVNYHKRIDSDLDAQLVYDYCKKHHLKYCQRDYQSQESGNFQKLARDFRYQFYFDLVKEYEAKGVYLAHHQDDALENYCMNIERGSMDNALLTEERFIEGICIRRPLLKMRKRDLYDYCDKYSIPYREDTSNHEDTYTRNRIRKAILELSDDAYSTWIIKMNEALQKQKEKDEVYFELIKNWDNAMKLDAYCRGIKQYGLDFLRYWLRFNGVNVYGMSAKQLNDMNQKIQNETMYEQFGDLYLSSSYGELWIGRQDGFAYKLDELTYFKSEYFTLSASGAKIQGVNLLESDFPIIIRNAREGDKILMRFGTKKLNRFFIDRKIPYHYRKLWVIVENSQKDVIFVAMLGCDVHHYANNPNLYVIE